MKYETILRKAAVRVDYSFQVDFGEWTHDCCCHAISRHSFLANQDATPIKEGFVVVFKPEGAHELSYWFGSPWSDIKSYSLKRKEHRVFALLFMAELAKDQGV